MFRENSAKYSTDYKQIDYKKSSFVCSLLAKATESPDFLMACRVLFRDVVAECLKHLLPCVTSAYLHWLPGAQSFV